VTTGKPVHSNSVVCVFTFAFDTLFNDFQLKICQINCSTVEKISIGAQCYRVWLPATCSSYLMNLPSANAVSLFIEFAVAYRFFQNVAGAFDSVNNKLEERGIDDPPLTLNI
jgi:hypothetical protein